MAETGISVEISRVLCPAKAATAATTTLIHVLPTVGRANKEINSPGNHPTPIVFKLLKGVLIPISPSPIFRLWVRSFQSSKRSIDLPLL